MAGAPVFTYALRRQERSRFNGRDEYLKGKVPEVAHRQMCQAICTTVQATPGFGVQGDADPWHGLPWLTLVLGSGCLELLDDPGFTADTLAQAVSAAIPNPEPPNGAEAPATIAGQFTRSLAKDRIRAYEVSGNGPNGTAQLPVVDPLGVQLTLIAALLTRFFHQVRSARTSAISRWGDDVAVLDSVATGYLVRDLQQRILEPVAEEICNVRRGLKECMQRDPGNQVVRAVENLLRAIHDGLRPDLNLSPSLCVDHLRVLTEVAWYFLTRGTSVYPGWTDLLLGLLLSEGDTGNPNARRTRPRFFDLRLLHEAVTALVEAPTEASWQSIDPRNGTATPRNRMYAASAEILWAQAAESRMASYARGLPPATAFVTSFDIELEMALWVSSAGRPFSVVVPVHLLHEPAADQAEPCWLIATIEPRDTGTWPDRLADLRRPTHWRLLTPNTDDELFRGAPVIVHLHGCPLLHLPDLARDPQLREDFTQGQGRLDDRAVLMHAVTVDEYLSLRQSDAELFWVSNHEADNGARSSRALPSSLTGDTLTNNRFWMALGVPVADPAIRHRMVSQIALRGLQKEMKSVGGGQTTRQMRHIKVPPSPNGGNERPATTSSRSTVNGVAINARINDDEATLLYWLGLDVIEAGCEQFIDDLSHYARHVSSTGPKNPPLTTPCKLR